ncbi:MAG: GTPase [Ruminococcaceae bacterium]|nr:GTPase [Oscillospiraceae bacterium]
MNMPVYLFTGFLEGGKTTIIQESLADKRFNSGEKTLLIMCEEGIEELDPSKFWGKNVTVRTIDDEKDLTLAKLTELEREHRYDRVIIEYNGMWTLDTLYRNMPRDWAIYQNMMFAEARTFLNYNANMRQLVFDKLKDAEMIVLNRAYDGVDKEEIHKVVRGISRRASIVYDYTDGHVEYDDIEDPLPFDVNAEVIDIKDEDFALWYRDLSENMKSYEGKTVHFKGLIARDDKLPSNSAIIGRHIMTCCADDIQYGGMVCVFKSASPLKTGDWISVKGKVKLETAKIYRAKGPVVYVETTEFAVAPKQEVATFY